MLIRSLRRLLDGHSHIRRALPLLVFLTLFGGDALRNALNWLGWALVCAAVAGVALTVLVRDRRVLRAPPPLLWVLLAYIAASTTWSAYPWGTLLGVITQVVTTAAAVAVATSTWDDTVAALGSSLRIVVSASLAFEFVVAALVRQPFCPVYVDCRGAPPAAFYWSRDLLLSGGRIQGLPGNSNLLAVFALLALLVTVIQWAAGQLGAVWAVLGIAGSLVALSLTRSATVLACAAALGIAGIAVIAVRRSQRAARPAVIGGVMTAVGAFVALRSVGSEGLLSALGKSSDLTGRQEIWGAVAALALDRPFFGWGWTGWWQPWLKPFANLAHSHGVVYLQAHNAYLDVWMQLGLLGLVIFVALLVTTLVGSWRLAVSKVGVGAEAEKATRLQVLPLLLLVVLLVHGIAESRLNVEWGWALLVLMAVEARRQIAPELRR